MGQVFSGLDAHMKAHFDAIAALKGTGSGVVTTKTVKNAVQIISSSIVNGTISLSDLKSHLAANLAAAKKLPAVSGSSGSTPPSTSSNSVSGDASNSNSVTTSSSGTSSGGSAVTTTSATPTSAPDTPSSTIVSGGTGSGGTGSSGTGSS